MGSFGIGGLGAQRGRLAGGSACPTRLHLTPWWHGGEARIGRAGRKLLTINGIKSWSLGTDLAECYGITSGERRAIVNLPSCRPANPGSMPSRMGAWQPERLRYGATLRRCDTALRRRINKFAASLEKC